MRETRSSGSVEGVMSNRDPYSASCVFASPPELRPAGRSSSQGLFAALRAIGPSLQYPLLRADEGASYPRLGERLVPHLRAPSGAGRLRVASSRTALPIH